MAGPIETPVAAGELVDKITILEIKSERLADPGKLHNVQAELDVLRARRDNAILPTPELAALAAQLKAVNARIWDMEDSIRACERRADFGPGFIAVARNIYRTNDERAALKRHINIFLASSLIEEKSYTPY